MKTLHFINGMPRSGSTLLANILNQNPDFRATPTSGICPLLIQTAHAWNGVPEIRASAHADDKLTTLRAMLSGFHSRITQPVVFDKSRGWVCAFEMLENLLGTKPKILVTYRDIPSILASCEKLFRRELATPGSTAKFGQNMETIEGRLAHWSEGTQLVGGAYNRIRDCVARGHGSSLHFVNFDDLTSNPVSTLLAVYDFLGYKYFGGHDFDNVEQSTHEKDSEHGFTDLHTIRRAVRPVKKDFQAVLGDAVKPYLGVSYNFIP